MAKNWIPAFAGMTIMCLILAGCAKETTSLPSHPPADGPTILPSAKIPAEVLKNALNTFAKAKSNGKDLSQGPCLGIIAPDWVLDVAHNPRQSIDDKSENQCVDYKNGKAHHFLEMDGGGQIIQVR